MRFGRNLAIYNYQPIEILKKTLIKIQILPPQLIKWLIFRHLSSFAFFEENQKKVALLAIEPLFQRFTG